MTWSAAEHDLLMQAYPDALNCASCRELLHCDVPRRDGRGMPGSLIRGRGGASPNGAPAAKISWSCGTVRLFGMTGQIYSAAVFAVISVLVDATHCHVPLVLIHVSTKRSLCT